MNKKKGDLLTRGVPEVCDEPAEDDRKRDEVQPVRAVVLFWYTLSGRRANCDQRGMDHTYRNNPGKVG